MKPRTLIAPEFLREILRCDPETGALIWRETPARPKEWNTKYAGKPAFTANHSSGYKWGTISNEQFLAHRVVWAIIYGEWPVEFIDHINGNRADNRPSNLRSVSQAENSKNAAKYKSNKSGFCGVYWSTHWQRWKASIVVDYRNIHVATSKCIAAAVIARHIAEIHNGFHANHGRNLL